MNSWVFLDKVYKIRDSLKDIPLFSPIERRNLPKLNQLDELNELEVNRIINSLASKSCEMDGITRPSSTYYYQYH